MLLATPQCCVAVAASLLWLLRGRGGTAVVHYGHAGEYQCDGYEFLPGEYVGSDDDADDGGNDGLQVAVETDECGTDAFLCDRQEKVGNEGGKGNSLFNSSRYDGM